MSSNPALSYQLIRLLIYSLLGFMSSAASAASSENESPSPNPSQAWLRALVIAEGEEMPVGKIAVSRGVESLLEQDVATTLLDELTAMDRMAPCLLYTSPSPRDS